MWAWAAMILTGTLCLCAVLMERWFRRRKARKKYKPSLNGTHNRYGIPEDTGSHEI